MNPVLQGRNAQNRAAAVPKDTAYVGFVRMTFTCTESARRTLIPCTVERVVENGHYDLH